MFIFKLHLTHSKPGNEIDHMIKLINPQLPLMPALAVHQGSKNMRKIVVRHCGDPHVMEIAQDDLPAPGVDEVQIRHHAIGLNYIDTYFRSGLYPSPIGLPFTPGLEAAGEVVAVGKQVTNFSVNDRVAYGTGPLGAYSEARNIPAQKIVPLPDNVDYDIAAAMMLKGMTVQYLLRQTYALKAGDTVLFHAAAGGVGLMFCQWAKYLGASVIGTVSSDAKAELAKANGCDHIINYTHEDFPKRVREITKGKGVPVVYDGVGKTTFAGSLDCLQPRGLMISFGNASGAVEKFDLSVLSAKGSLYLTRPTLMNYTASYDQLTACAAEVMQMIADGHLKIDIRQKYGLDDAVQAHLDLEGRKTTGATIITPN